MINIVKALNIVISNPDKISEVQKGRQRNELFFKYIGKQKWSILKRTAADGKDDYTAFYYPSAQHRLQSLAQFQDDDWQHVEMVSFKTTALKTREALETFSELYSLISSKIYNLDNVFKEILESDESESSE